MKKFQISLFLILFSIVFLYGFAVGNFQIFPYDLLQNFKNSFPSEIDSQSFSNNSLSAYEVDSYLKIKNIDDLLQKRQNLIHHIWKTQEIPTSVPFLIEENISDERYSDLQNLKGISKITSKMDFEVTSIAYLFESVSSNGELVIYHQGHRGDFIHGKNTIESLLENGYSVLSFSMPLMGMNNQPLVHTESFGPITLNSHNKLQFIETNDFSPIKFFVEPIYVSLNYVDEQYTFTKYHFIGISGGGWTAIIYSSIDDRISNTFSVAGSLPIFLREDPKDLGDYEQINPKLYSIANYLEMYVMSSYGENRNTTLIYNKFDPCCFDGNSSLIFLEPVQKTLNQLEKGDFDIIIDDTTNKHEISEYSLNQILKLMK